MRRVSRVRPVTRLQSMHPVSAISLSLLIAGTVFPWLVGCKSGRPLTTTTSQAQPHIDFNKDVQPILANNCIRCHGPDPETRRGGLRLDLEESAFRKRAGKPDAIVREIQKEAH